MERRKPPTRPNELATPLPKDYLRLVGDVFHQNFHAELEKLAERGRPPVFEAAGANFPTEAVLSVSLVQEGKMGATTVHASSDFELGDDAPADAEARLAACVDAIGGIFSELLAPEALPRLKLGTLATLSEVPPGWSETSVRDRAVYVLVDSSNPRLEAMTEEWLKTHAPDEPLSVDDEDELFGADESIEEDADSAENAAPALIADSASSTVLAKNEGIAGSAPAAQPAGTAAPSPTKH